MALLWQGVASVAAGLARNATSRGLGPGVPWSLQALVQAVALPDGYIEDVAQEVLLLALGGPLVSGAARAWADSFRSGAPPLRPDLLGVLGNPAGSAPAK